MSVYVLLLGILFLVVCGLPLTYLAYSRLEAKNGAEVMEQNVFWTMTLFAGYAILTLPLRIIIRLNIPLKYSSFPVAVLFLAILVIFLLKKPKLPKVPVWLSFGLLAVIIICGFEYFIIGAQWYRGYDWYDMTFYGPQAQFLIDYPMNTAADSVKNAPWLSLITHNNSYYIHRISRGVLQGFLTVVGFLPDATYTLGFISLLGPIFTFSATICVVSKFHINPKLKIVASIWAATIPGYTLLNLDCFIGSSLMVGFIIIWGFLIYDLAEHFNIPKLILISLIFAAASTTYTEMTYVLVGLSLVVFVFGLARVKVRQLLLSLTTIPLGFLFNIQYFIVYKNELSLGRLESTEGLDPIYSQFAFKPSGLSVLFFGKDSNTFKNIPLSEIFSFCAICLLFIAIVGIILLIFKEKFPYSLPLLCIAVLPILFILSDKTVSLYKFYRMLSQAAPVLAIGIIYSFYMLYNFIHEEAFNVAVKNTVIRRTTQRVLILCSGCIIIFSSLMTTINSTGTVAMGYQKNKYFPIQYDFLNKLSQTKGKDIYLISTADFMDSWSVYYARNNKVWLSRYPWVVGWVFDPKASYFDYNTIPDDCEIMIMPGVYNPVQDSKLTNIIGAYFTDSKFTQINYPMYCPNDNKFYMDVYSKQNRKVMLSLLSKSVPEGTTIEIEGKIYKLSSNQKINARVELKRGKQDIAIVVRSANGNKIKFDDWSIVSD